MNARQWLTLLAQFEPKLRPLIPDTLAMLDTFAQLQRVLAPATARLEANQPAFLELLSAAPTLSVMQPQIIAALRTKDKLTALALAWEERPLTKLKGVKMDMNTVNGVIRAVVPAALAYAVGKGWVSSSSVADITAAVLAVAAAGWSVWTNSGTTKTGA